MSLCDWIQGIADSDLRSSVSLEAEEDDNQEILVGDVGDVRRLGNNTVRTLCREFFRDKT
jgi:hypothetical protein